MVLAVCVHLGAEAAQQLLIDDVAVCVHLGGAGLGVVFRDNVVDGVGQGLGKGVELVLVVEGAALDALPGVADVGAPAVDVVGGSLQGALEHLHRLVGGNPPQTDNAGAVVLGHLDLVVFAAVDSQLAVDHHVDGAVLVGVVGDVGVLGKLIQKEVALVVQLVGTEVGVGLEGGRVVHNGLVQPGQLHQLFVHVVHRNAEVVDLLFPGAVQLAADLLEGLGNVFHGGGDDVGVGLRIGVDRKALEGVAEGHQDRPQAGIAFGVKLVEGGLDVPQDLAGAGVVPLLGTLVPVALIQVDVPGLADAGNVHALSGGAHPAGGIAVAVAVRGHSHLGDPLAGVAGGVPVGQVLAGDVQALLGSGETLFGGLES